jgi:hypothetical protein
LLESSKEIGCHSIDSIMSKVVSLILMYIGFSNGSVEISIMIQKTYLLFPQQGRQQDSACNYEEVTASNSGPMMVKSSVLSIFASTALNLSITSSARVGAMRPEST